jgi:hypothetical protein
MATQNRTKQHPDLSRQIGSMQFARAARTLGEAATRGGLVVPAFRSPPRQAGTRRALQRRTDGSVTVAVALRDRPWLAVQADMVDGVLAANEFTDSQKVQWRDRLFGALMGADGICLDGPDAHHAVDAATQTPTTDGVPQAA